MATTLAPVLPAPGLAFGPATIIRSAAELLQAMRASRETALFRADASGLDRVLRVDGARGLVELQAATTWQRLAAGLADRHPWLQRLADEPGELPATVGQALAENPPGPDGLPFVAHVESLTVATAEGELRRVNRHDHPDLFALIAGGQGVIAAAYSITLRLETLERSVGTTAPAVLLDRYAPRRTPAPTETLRLLVPPEAATSLAGQLRDLLRDWRIEPLAIEARAVRAEQETFLRWAARDAVLLRLTLPRPSSLADRVRAQQLAGEAIECSLACGGSFPIASTRSASRQQVERCYPQLHAFLAEKKRQDPRECLSNGWYRHYRQLMSGEACPVHWDAAGESRTPTAR